MAYLADGEKNFEDAFVRFHMIHERDTHTHTDTIAALMHSIARQKLFWR